MSVAAVIVAAGSGQRLGGPPKQFRPLGGRPMLSWSCELFSRNPAVSELIVVVPSEVLQQPPSWLQSYDAVLVGGGSTRSESVASGLSAIQSAEMVAIHDAARPFVTAALLSSLLAAAEKHVAVIPVLEIPDAIKRVQASDGSSVSGTLDRSELRAAQTPQVFPVRLIRDLHERASASGHSTPDDAALAEAGGVVVRTVPGERWAFKVTRPEDLALSEWLVETGRVRFGGGP